MDAFNVNSPRTLFEEFAKEKPHWTDELETLATGYLAFLIAMNESDSPLNIIEACAAASALATFARKAEWISHAAQDALMHTAVVARHNGLQRFRGKMLVVRQSQDVGGASRLDERMYAGPNTTH